MTRFALGLAALGLAGCPMTHGADASLDFGAADAPAPDLARSDLGPEPPDAGDAASPADGAPPVDGGPTRLDVDGVSLVVTASLSRLSGSLLSAPSTYAFTLRLADTADPAVVDVVASMQGSVVTTTLARDGNVLTGAFGASPVDAAYACTYVGRIVVGGTLTLVDADGDGRVDSASGSGTAYLELYYGDLGYSPTADAVLVGVADMEPPTLTQRNEDGALVLMEHLEVFTSEAIPSSSWPVLDLGPALPPRPLAPQDGTAAYASRFALATTDLLPFGAAGHVTSPALVDLAGNGGPADLPVAIAPDVGLLSETGFEEASPALVIDGNARIVTGLGTLGAISGTRSLFVGASVEYATAGTLHGGRVIARLAVAPADTRVRATLRMVGSSDSFGRTFDGRVVVYSPAGDPVPATDLTTLAATGSTPTGLPEYPSASDRFTLDLALPPHVTDEVVILFSTRTNDCGHPPLGPTNGLLVDDLRVE